MKLCIVKPDDTIAEVLMLERQPSLDAFNNELLFFENYQYRLLIRDNEAVDNVELFVGDYSVQLHYNPVTDCFETETELLFDGCFDLAYVTVYVNDGEGDEKVFYSDFLRIATTKQTAIQVEKMLREIEENVPNFLEICFSRNRKKSGLIKNELRSIWNTLKIVDEIIMVYEDNYGYFSNNKKASVEPVATIVDAKAMRTINQESLRWMVCNPNNFIQTDKDSGIEIKGKNFTPSKVKTYLSRYSYDVYENRVVLGFLHNVVDYLDNLIVGFNKEIIELANVPQSIVVQLPNTHELTGRCIYIYYKGIIERLNEKKSLLQEMYYKYEKVLECPTDNIYGTPKLTNTFKQVYHYRLCYECMVKWFKAGDYTFDHLNYLFKLKTLSRIFEYFCLIKLQTALGKCGFIFQEANRIIYDIEDDTEEINNQYVFNRNGYKLTLLYEPFIWVNKVNEGMNLYSTGYNFLKSRWNDKWKPDFVLKISSSYRDYYYILDAKYSNIQNVKKRHMPELILKYSTQIASVDKFITDVIGVGAVYPGEQDKIYYFKKNKVGSLKQSIPIYFSLSIVGENVGDVMLKERLTELLDMIDVIEEEKENEEGSKIKAGQTPIIAEKNIVYKGNEQKESTLANVGEALNLQIFSDMQLSDDSKDSVKKVNGKKCFYYAKGMCMYQKIRCTIADEPCSFYISKKSKELLKEQDICRNFTRYTRRGKLDRVECSVSGRPGCIGQDECKFCLRKNKSRRSV
jgi:predicted component of viral defense system (DUF524 family)